MKITIIGPGAIGLILAKEREKKAWAAIYGKKGKKVTQEKPKTWNN